MLLPPTLVSRTQVSNTQDGIKTLNAVQLLVSLLNEKKPFVLILYMIAYQSTVFVVISIRILIERPVLLMIVIVFVL